MNALKKAKLFLLPEHTGYCKACSALIATFKRVGNDAGRERAIGKLSGYLNALADCGVITDKERAILFEHYFTADRSMEVTE